MSDSIPPLDDLDPVFDLPPETDSDLTPELRSMYEVLINRLRREAAEIPHMNTIQLLLVERIARNYVILRLKESRAANDGGFAHATAQKEFNSFWLTMTQEFNRLLRSAPDQAFWDQLTKKITTAFAEAVDSEVGDQDLRITLKKRFAETTEKAGL